ncbi:hypothetical protein ACIGEZ_26585 [Streptomyces sp. NPDC085481]|uniref:effector-associated constant component EACC1 n=1 Tax=Streptomyces sp. NPDC085481 TaxID=3365727 RepID=UPI0037D4122C
MRIRITSGGDEYALTDLRSWLAQDPGTAALPVEPVAGVGPTMSALEAIDIVLGHATDIAAFAVAYATWRSARNQTEDGAGELVYGDTTTDISHLSPEQLADLLGRLNGGDPESSPA